jgi:hypothetical protein
MTLGIWTILFSDEVMKNRIGGEMMATSDREFSRAACILKKSTPKQNQNSNQNEFQAWIHIEQHQRECGQAIFHEE